MGFSVLLIWPTFGSVFIRFCRLARFGAGGFSPIKSLVFGRFLSFFAQCIQYGFSGVAKEVTPFSRAKTVIPRDNLHSVLPFTGVI